MQCIHIMHILASTNIRILNFVFVILKYWKTNSMNAGKERMAPDPVVAGSNPLHTSTHV